MSTDNQVTTRSRASLQHERLIKRVDVFLKNHTVGNVILSAARTLLEQYPVNEGMPTPAEVYTFLQSMMPSPEIIFTREYFQAPMFPIATLRDVAKFYGCGDLTQSRLTRINPPSSGSQKESCITHAWIATLLNCNEEETVSAVKAYLTTRSSPSYLTQPSPPQTAQPIQGAQLSRNPTDGDNSQAQTSQVNGNRNPGLNSESALRQLESFNTPDDDSRNAESSGATAGASGSVRDRSYDMDDSRKSTNVLKFFQNSLFDGSFMQSIEETLQNYEICAQQHKLSPRQMATFFVNAFCGPARTFFIEQTKGKNLSFEQMAKLMKTEYNANARQLRALRALENARLAVYLAKKRPMSTAVGLDHLVNLVHKLTPQCPQQFRFEANKISFLRKAVLGFTWAKDPIKNIVTSKFSFNAFVTALHESLQLEEEEAAERTVIEDNTVNPKTYYQRYGRHPKYVRKHQDRSITFEESRKRGLCHSCHEKWSPKHKCRPGAIRNHVRNRITQGDSPVHIVHDLVTALETNPHDHEQELGAEEACSGEHSAKICHGTDPDNTLSEFDGLTNGGSQHEYNLAEEADQAILTNYVSPRIAADFREGGSPE